MNVNSKFTPRLASMTGKGQAGQELDQEATHRPPHAQAPRPNGPLQGALRRPPPTALPAPASVLPGRAEPLDGDLIIDRDNRSAIGTVLERLSR